MSIFRSSSNYCIPSYFKDQANEMKNIEAEANEALKNIRTLYKDIMQIDSHDEHEFEGKTEEVFESEITSPETNRENVRGDVIKSKKKPSFPCFNSMPQNSHCRVRDRNSVDDLHLHSMNHKFDHRQLVHQQKMFDCTLFNSTLSSHLLGNYLNNQSSNFSSSIKSSQKNSKYSPKVTVPQPFTLSGFDQKRLEAKQTKLAKLRDELDREAVKELNVKVISKPVPKHVRLPLYNEMVEKDVKRKAERKIKSLEVVGKASKFSETNETSECNLKLNSLCDKDEKTTITFKAAPIPKSILSEKVSAKLKNKEEIRKMLIAHRAEEMLKQSSSPFSKKNISRSYSAFNNLNNFTIPSDNCKVTKSDIMAITNRLYTVKCKETIENWDNKIMRYCHKEKSSKPKNISEKPKPLPEQVFPFLYYPIRMSTAASLRDKQIR